MFGGEMTMMDDFTYSLITNKELLDINAFSSENKPLLWDKEKAVWSCKDKNGKKVFAFFNLKNEEKEIILDADAAEVSSFGVLRDIWTGEKISADKKLFVNFHGRGSKVFVTE